MSRLAYRCDRVQSQQVYFPQEPARLGIGGRAEVENERVRLRLYLLKSLAPATSPRPHFPPLPFRSLAAVERNVQLVQPDQGPIAGNLPHLALGDNLGPDLVRVEDALAALKAQREREALATS